MIKGMSKAYVNAKAVILVVCGGTFVLVSQQCTPSGDVPKHQVTTQRGDQTVDNSR